MPEEFGPMEARFFEPRLGGPAVQLHERLPLRHRHGVQFRVHATPLLRARSSWCGRVQRAALLPPCLWPPREPLILRAVACRLDTDRPLPATIVAAAE